MFLLCLYFKFLYPLRQIFVIVRKMLNEYLSALLETPFKFPSGSLKVPSTVEKVTTDFRHREVMLTSR